MKKKNLLIAITTIFFLVTLHTKIGLPQKLIVNKPYFSPVVIEQSAQYPFNIRQTKEPLMLDTTITEKSNRHWAANFSLSNLEHFGIDAYLKIGYNHHAKIFSTTKKGLKIVENGLFVPISERAMTDYTIVKISIPARDTAKIQLLIENRQNIRINHKITVLNEWSYLKYESENRKSNQSLTLFHVLFVGAMGFTAIFMLFMWLINYDKTFLYYGLYLFLSSLYIFPRLDTSLKISYWFQSWPFTIAAANETIQMLFFASYHLFVIHFLELFKTDKKLFKVINVYILVLISYGFIHFFIYYFSNDSQVLRTLFAISRACLTLSTIVFLVRIYIKCKLPYTRYLLLGTFCFLITGILATYYTSNPNKQTLLQIAPITWFEIGLLAEASIFGLGLGYRFKALRIEKEKSQAAYISQIEINEEFVKNANLALEAKIEQRTKEIQTKTIQLEKSKNEKLKADFESKMAKAQMAALRSQMNPHFLFNGLNAIRYLIQQGNPKVASEYLIRFSKLLRKVLELSRKEIVPLKADLEALEIYIRIEMARFDQKFDFKINIAEEIDLNQIMIPPMLLQPIVENAIWHGLMPRTDSGGFLLINIYKDAIQGTCIDIEDNGVGRKLSSNNDNLIAKTHHSSMGNLIINERIDLFNKNYETKLKIDTIDFKLTQHNKSGTLVRIIII